MLTPTTHAPRRCTISRPIVSAAHILLDLTSVSRTYRSTPAPFDRRTLSFPHALVAICLFCLLVPVDCALRYAAADTYSLCPPAPRRCCLLLLICLLDTTAFPSSPPPFLACSVRHLCPAAPRAEIIVYCSLMCTLKPQSISPCFILPPRPRLMGCLSDASKRAAAGDMARWAIAAHPPRTPRRRGCASFRLPGTECTHQLHMSI